MAFKDILSPKQAWELYIKEFPDTPLVLHHIGPESKSIFVHSPLSNKRDEHTDHCSKWMWADKSRWRVGVGVMTYDNWLPPEPVIDTPPEEAETEKNESISTVIRKLG